MKKTIWIYSYDNGDYTQADCLVGDISLTEEQVKTKAFKNMAENNDMSLKEVKNWNEITEVFPVDERLLKQLK